MGSTLNRSGPRESARRTSLKVTVGRGDHAHVNADVDGPPTRERLSPGIAVAACSPGNLPIVEETVPRISRETALRDRPVNARARGRRAAERASGKAEHVMFMNGFAARPLL